MQPSEEYRLPVFEADDLRFDTQQQQVFLRGERIAVPGKSMKLLQVLMEQAPQVLSKDQLFELVWDGRAVSESVLTTAVKELRKSLGDTARSPVYIQTVHGRGYRFLPAVAEEGKAAPIAEDQRLSPQAADSADAGHPTVAPRVSHSHQLVALLLVLAMAITAFLLATRSHDQADNRQLSIAVLPFDDLSPTQDQSWFAIGLMEEMLNTLARAPRVRVTGRTATLAMIERGLSAAQIAARLQADYILEGSVHIDAGQISISAHLIDTNDQSQVWAQTYDYQRGNAISAQETIAGAIADALGVAADPDVRAQMVSVGTRSPAAYETYLKALARDRAALRTGQTRFNDEAAVLFEESLSHDPNFLGAHLRLAAFQFQRLHPRFIGTLTSLDVYQEQRQKFLFHTNEAIRLTKDRARQLLLESSKSVVTLEFRKQARLLSQYLDLRPNDLQAMLLLSEAGLNTNELALVLDTISRMEPLLRTMLETGEIPNSIPISFATFANQPTLGIGIAEAILDKFPEHALALHAYHRALLAAGQISEARAILPRVQASGLPDVNKNLAALRQACADGDHQSTQELVGSIRNISEATESVPPLWLAYMIVGQREKADKLIEPMNTPERLPQLAGFLGYPHFDPSKYDQLQAVMVRENIPPRTPRYPVYICRAN